MAMLRLLLAGFLIASGLILGAFTLHGYLDPNWPQNRMQAANAGPAVAIPAVPGEPRNRNQFVARQPDPPPPGPTVKTGAKPAPPAEVRAEARAPSKPAARKKVAEKPEKPPARPQQQASSAGFPWNLFGN
jgi:hypothetical protein